MFFSTVFIEAMLLSGLASALVVEKRNVWATGNVVSVPGADGTLKEYTIVDPTITGFVNGVEVSVNGTEQEWLAAAKKVDPSFERGKAALGNLETRNELEARVDQPPNYQGMFCHVNGWKSVRPIHGQFIAVDLDKWNHVRYIAPTTCFVLHELEGAQAWWCNDAPHPQHIHTTHLADMVMWITDKCRDYFGNINGQTFDNRGFNIILRSR